MKTITVINAYGDKNIGDATILNVALELINEAYKNCEINLLIENKDSYKKFTKPATNIIPFQLPYGNAIQSNRDKAPLPLKTFRFLKIYIITFCLISMDMLRISGIPQKGFYSYINAIKNADIVIGMGGGYLIAKSPVTDYFGLMLSLLPIYVAKIYKRRTIFLPMSFGPFASRTQEKLAFWALQNTTVMARDKITLNELGKNNRDKKVNAFYAPDLGLFFNNKSYDINRKLRSKYIVLTARKWLPRKGQDKYEHTLSNLVDYAWEKFQLKTVFISMACNRIEDDDDPVALRIKSNLIHRNIFHIADITGLQDLQRIIGLSRIGVFTRMHSAILSLTVRSPFIAIGYAHKTLGLVKSYNLGKWYIDINRVDDMEIKKMFDLLLMEDNYRRFTASVSRIQKNKQHYKELIIKVLKT